MWVGVSLSLLKVPLLQGEKDLRYLLMTAHPQCEPAYWWQSDLHVAQHNIIVKLIHKLVPTFTLHSNEMNTAFSKSLQHQFKKRM